MVFNSGSQKPVVEAYCQQKALSQWWQSLYIELEGWVTVNNMYDRISSTLCLYFVHRKEWHLTKLFIFWACPNKIQIRTWSHAGSYYFCYLELLIQYYLVQDISHKIYCVPWLDDPNSRSWGGGGVCHQQFTVFTVCFSVAFREWFKKLLKLADTIWIKPCWCAYEERLVFFH